MDFSSKSLQLPSFLPSKPPAAGPYSPHYIWGIRNGRRFARELGRRRHHDLHLRREFASTVVLTQHVNVNGAGEGGGLSLPLAGDQLARLRDWRRPLS